MHGMSQRRSVGYARHMTAVGLMAALALPGVAWAQDDPVFAVFGRPAYSYTDPDGYVNEVPASPGVPLTCANASTAAAQMNSGNAPGMQASAVEPDNLPPGLPNEDLQMRGWAARLVPTTTAAGWAAAPAGSQWVYQGFDISPEYVAFPVGIYLPTAADAARMRVTMQYRANDQLIGIYRNALGSGNTLASPLAAGTWTAASSVGTVALDSGWRAGVNMLTFVVKGKADADGNMMTAFAAAFDAYCAPITPTAVPTSNEWGLLLLGLLAAGAGAVQLRRRR